MSSTHRGTLRGGTLDVGRVVDANRESKSQAVVQAVQFHPTAPAMLTAGLDKTLRVFQIDGKRNVCLQSTYLKDLPIYSAAFTPDGNEVRRRMGKARGKLWREGLQRCGCLCATASAAAFLVGAGCAGAADGHTHPCALLPFFRLSCQAAGNTFTRLTSKAETSTALQSCTVCFGRPRAQLLCPACYRLLCSCLTTPHSLFSTPQASRSGVCSGWPSARTAASLPFPVAAVALLSLFRARCGQCRGSGPARLPCALPLSPWLAHGGVASPLRFHRQNTGSAS